MLDVFSALKTRKSVRAFTNQTVSVDQVKRIIDAARWAPSGTNTQPWQVHAVSGSVKQKLDAELIKAFESEKSAQMDYNYYPENWFEPYNARRRECGLAMFSALDITRQDKEKRLAQWKKNYSAFGAPWVLFFTMDHRLESGSFFDYGMFYQSIMLAAQAEGLATCPQAALAEYPDVLREHLDIDSEHIILCGLALGYENPEDPVNQYRTSRREVDDILRFYS